MQTNTKTLLVVCYCWMHTHQLWRTWWHAAQGWNV